MEVRLGRGNIVLDGDQLPPQKKWAQQPRPQFSAQVYCGQTAVCIRIALGMEVGLSLGDIVLDGDPAPPSPNAAQPPTICGECPLWPNGWMDQGASWYGGKPRPRRRCLTCSRSSLPLKGHSRPVFGPCLLWPWSPISATAELLLLLC